MGGEVLYRSSPHIHGEGQLLNSMGSQLRDFLKDGMDSRTAVAKRDVALAEIRLAHANAMACRKARMLHLGVPKSMVDTVCQRLLTRANAETSDINANVYDTRRRLDRYLSNVILQYYSTAEMEMQMLERKCLEDNKMLDDLVRQVQESQKLRMFALHLEHETDRRVVLKKLSPDNPQYQRCQRAASENVKPSYLRANLFIPGLMSWMFSRLKTRPS